MSDSKVTQLYLNTAEAALFMGITADSLEYKRLKGQDSPPYSKFGRTVRYNRDDIVAWMNERKRHAPECKPRRVASMQRGV